MAKSTGKCKNGLAPNAVLAWILNKCGVPISDICKKVKRKKTAVYEYIEAVEEAVGEPIKPEDLRSAFYLLMIPLITQSLVYNLKKKKEHTTNNLANKLLFGDIKDSESLSQTNVFNLGPGFDQDIGQADTELLKEIRDRLRDGNRKAGAPPVVSRLESSSDDQR